MKKESIKAKIKKRAERMPVFQQRMVYGYAVLLLRKSLGPDAASLIPKERPAPGQIMMALGELLDLADKRTLFCLRKCVYYVEKHKIVSDLLAEGYDAPWIMKMYEAAERSARWKLGSLAPLYRKHRMHSKK